MIGPPEYLRALEDDVDSLWEVSFCDMSFVEVRELSALENGFGRVWGSQVTLNGQSKKIE